MRNKFRTMGFAVVLMILSCKEPYNPPVIANANSYLVVEGVINSGSDSTVITISRTVNLSARVTSNPVTGAMVTVEGDQNSSYPLFERSPGIYAAAALNLDNAHKYRLDIKTGGEQYLSDFEPVLNSPPIDSVNFTIAGNGINIYSNTHDPTNTIKYYRWDFQETWMIHSNYDSFFISNGDTVLARDYINDQIYTCWASDASSSIILNSSARLTKSVIVNNPVTFVASTSEKLGDKYSILVRQYALSGDAYNFWVNLKKNTEQLGSIFDAQPSQINGNIHSVTKPNEPVIGYISVGGTASTRIFITNQQLPNWTVAQDGPVCSLDTYYYAAHILGVDTPINEVNEFINYDKGAMYPQIPVNAISLPGKPPIGYSASTKECVDCTLRGSNKQPSFWK